MGKCEDCRICHPSGIDLLLSLSIVFLMTVLLLLKAEPPGTRCPICGHPLKYHDRRTAG